MSGWLDNPMEGLKDIAGFGAEMLLDPMNLIPVGAVGRALKGRKAARASNAAAKAERGGKYAFVNPKVAGRKEVLSNPLLPEGIPELQPGFARAVHWASPENVDNIRESGLDYSRQGMLSSTAQVWGDGSKVNYLPPDDPRFGGGQAVVFDFPENELRLHDNVARSPGVLDPKYFVGAVPRTRSQLELDRYKLMLRAQRESPLMDEDVIGMGLNHADVTGYAGQVDDLTRQIEPLRADNPMKLLGYTPAPEDPMFPGVELMHHGGHDMSASATKANPYGVFDLGRLKTGEGNNMFSPGAYTADAEATSARYREIVQERLDDQFYRSESALAKYFEPGRILHSPQGYHTDKVLEFKPADADGNWAVKVQSLVKEDNGEYRANGRPRWHATMPDANQFKRVLGENPNKARLYKYDAPIGTKDRFLNWEATYDEQPDAVKNLFPDPFPGVTSDLWGEVNSLADMRQMSSNLSQERWGLVGSSNPMDIFRADTLYQQIDELATQIEQKRQYLFDKNVPGELLWTKYPDDVKPTGESIVDSLLGGRPADATLADTVGMREAGIPGVKNLAGSTGRTSYNYAIWDQDLLNSMRVREIDGQRVPINPTTMSQQVEQRLPQAVDSQLTSTMNPMALQAEPGIAAPAVAGAVYNALQAVNRYGGIQ
jgi:hypothetical protein